MTDKITVTCLGYDGEKLELTHDFYYELMCCYDSESFKTMTYSFRYSTYDDDDILSDPIDISKVDFYKLLKFLEKKGK